MQFLSLWTVSLFFVWNIPRIVNAVQWNSFIVMTCSVSQFDYLEFPYVCKPGESFGRYRCEHQLDLSNSYSMKLWVKSIKILRLVCANGLNGQTWKQCQNHNFIPHDFLDLHLYLLIVDYFRPNKSCPSPTCTNCARPIISALRLFLARLVHHLLHSHWCTMCILLLCSVEHHPVLS